MTFHDATKGSFLVTVQVGFPQCPPASARCFLSWYLRLNCTGCFVFHFYFYFFWNTVLLSVLAGLALLMKTRLAMDSHRFPASASRLLADVPAPLPQAYYSLIPFVWFCACTYRPEVRVRSLMLRDHSPLYFLRQNLSLTLEITGFVWLPWILLPLPSWNWEVQAFATTPDFLPWV